jgi:membrane protein involved in D-alanine export
MITEPFSTLHYFLTLALLLLPAIILGLKEKRSFLYEIFFTTTFLIIIFYKEPIDGFTLFAYAIYLVLLNIIFSHIIQRKKHWAFLWIFIILSLIPLLASRISTDFFVIGLSYMSFRAIQIIIETHNELIKKISFIETLYFLLFVPAISAGPIDRSRRFLKDKNTKRPKEEYEKLLRKGIFRIFLGIAYKFILSLIIYHFWLSTIPKTATLLSSINYMYAYSLYLFFDFAGYSLMAIGVSNILNYDFPENFNLPFISKDIKEFWNRWHLTLSFWLRDFLYTPLVMALLKKKYFKSRYTASYIGYITTMTIMGLWHGFTIYYAFYGLYHGLLLVLNDLIEQRTSWYRDFRDSKSGSIILIFICFNLVCFGFLIFSGYNFKNGK